MIAVFDYTLMITFTKQLVFSDRREVCHAQRLCSINNQLNDAGWKWSDD
jgi:hypothetical protein